MSDPRFAALVGIGLSAVQLALWILLFVWVVLS